MNTKKSRYQANKRGPCPRMTAEQKKYAVYKIKETHTLEDLENTLALKSEIIFYVNEFQKKFNKGIIVTDIKKSTLYDMLNIYGLNTPLQSKRLSESSSFSSSRTSSSSSPQKRGRSQKVMNYSEENSLLKEMTPQSTDCDDEEKSGFQVDLNINPKSPSPVRTVPPIMKKAIRKEPLTIRNESKTDDRITFNKNVHIFFFEKKVINMEADLKTRYLVTSRKAEIENSLWNFDDSFGSGSLKW